jgi:hypothetical protein
VSHGGDGPPDPLALVSTQVDAAMNRGLIWTIVGVLLIIALIIWIARAV